MSTSCKNNPTPPSAGKASTNNWDTVFALNFANANKAIKGQKSSPSSFSGTKPGGGFSGPAVKVDGQFGDWQLSGGSGSLAELTLPILGKATAQTQPKQSLEFKGSAAIEISLQYLPQPKSPSSGKDSGGIVHALKPNLKTSDPKTQPIVSIISLSLNKEAAAAQDAIKDVLSQWLLENLGEFNHTFAAIDLGAVADKKQFQWLNPTKVSYGINNPDGAKVDDYIFAVMAMTENRPGENLGHEVSPNIIPSGCNAGFLISQERFMTKIMLPGMEKMFLNATVSDLQVTGDGSTITNTQALTFHDFVTSSKDGDKITITGATLDEGKFQVIAEATTLSLNFTDLHFPWSHGAYLQGGYTVHINYVAQSELYMDENKNFQACTVGSPSVSVNVTESSAEKWTDLIVGIVEGIALSIAGAMIGGALGPEVEEASEGLQNSGKSVAGDVVDSTDKMEFNGDFPSDNEISNEGELNSQEEKESATEMKNADNSSYKAKFKGFFRRNWRKMLGTAIGGAVGAVTAEIPDILEAYSEEDLEKMPTLDDFVEYSVSPLTWPGQTGYTLKSVALNESLQMGLDVQISD